MRCAYCGKKLRDTAKFCPYCGKVNDDSGSEFAEKFNSENGLLVVKTQEIFRDGSPKAAGINKKRTAARIALTICAAAVFTGICTAAKAAVTEIRYISAEKLYIGGELEEAEKNFSKLGEYKNSAGYVLKCRYEKALELMDGKLFPEAADAFTALDGYANSDALAAECMLEIADGYAKSGDLASAASVYAAAGRPELIESAAEEKAASMAEKGDFFGAAEISEKYLNADTAWEYRYSGACSAKENGDFKTAADNFYILKDYKNSAKLAEECAYSYYSSEYAENGASEETVRGFFFLGDYRDSKKMFGKSSYEYGLNCLENGDCFTAAAMFSNSGNYENSEEMLRKARYSLGTSLLEDDPASARSVFALLSTYSDSAKKKKSAAERLSEKESWYADGLTYVGNAEEKYYTSVFKKSDILTIFCTAGTDTISAPVTLALTLTDSAGKSLSADCENVRNSGSFSVSFSVSDLSAGTAEITVTRKDSGNVLRKISIVITD